MLLDIFRWFVILTGGPFVMLYFKTKLYFVGKKPKGINKIKGPVLIVSNHFSFMDYVVNMLALLPRKSYVVAAEFAFKNAFTRFFMKMWGGIKADRVTKNMHFVDECVSVLNDGHLVQIFPEAKSSKDGVIKKFYASYVSIALKANVPIVLMVSNGRYGIFKRMRIMVDEPINLYDYLDDEKYKLSDVYRLNDMVYERAKQLKKALDDKTYTVERMDKN